jgi:hypothetical protein
MHALIYIYIYIYTHSRNSDNSKQSDVNYLVFVDKKLLAS